MYIFEATFYRLLISSSSSISGGAPVITSPALEPESGEPLSREQHDSYAQEVLRRLGKKGMLMTIST
jgi:hypothetical protein